MNVSEIDQINPYTAIRLAKLARDNNTTVEELCEELLKQKANSKGRKAYSVDDVANILGVTRRTVYSYISTGGLKAFKVGNRWRVSDIALDNLFLTGMKPGAKEEKPKYKVEETNTQTNEGEGLDNSFLSEEYEQAIRRR